MKKLSRQIGGILVPPLIYLIMRFIWYTTRKKFHFITPLSDAQHVCVCWHGELFMSPQAYRKLHKNHSASAIISQHFDGQLIADTLQKLRIFPLRGSSNKGANKVLLQAFRALKEGQEVLITPDGPRGPRHTMNDGVVGLALKSKLPIFVMNYTAKNYWQLGSWDRFVIPKPFTSVDFYIQSLTLEGMSLEEAKTFLSAKMLEHTIQ